MLVGDVFIRKWPPEKFGPQTKQANRDVLGKSQGLILLQGEPLTF